MTEEMKSLRVSKTPIAGLLVVDLPLHGDNRGWFKEHWQREKMVALGLPDFGPVQQNISFNAEVGTTRGVHAEPWDKYVSVANGRAFGAWVDLREGDSFGTSFSIELTPSRAVFVPRGVANAFQTLEPNTSYMYLVNDHWTASAKYTLVNPGDPALGIDWPIPLSEAVVSEKDLSHPGLASINPVEPRVTVVIGATGQLGRALQDLLPPDSTRFLSRMDIDLSDLSSIDNYDWNSVGTIINAAAFTAVDDAESLNGRKIAWQVNSIAVAELAKIAAVRNATFVSVSSDYVFDGVNEVHTENEPFSPVSVYGQTKAAGEIAAMHAPKHYILRTSWVVGDGHNFVKTMHTLALRGIRPQVVSDQLGRLTFTSELARAIVHLLSSGADYGTYNVTCSGPQMTWFDIAQIIYRSRSLEPTMVSPTTSEEYAQNQIALGKPIAPRPAHSTLDLSKICATGFQPQDAQELLSDYLDELK